MTEHPTPWRVIVHTVPELLKFACRIEDANGTLVVELGDCDKHDTDSTKEIETAHRIVAAVNGEAQWRQERAELVDALDWAMQYGTFEVATDNPMQARAHRHARDLLERMKKEATNEALQAKAEEAPDAICLAALSTLSEAHDAP